MGAAMAKNMVDAGRHVVAFDVTSDGISAAEAAGARTVKSVAEVGQLCPELVLTMLPNDRILREVTDALLPNLAPGATHASCATVSPVTGRDLADLHAAADAADIRYVSAPIFARPDGVAAKSGVFMLSGDVKGVAVAAPVLADIVGVVQEFGEDPGAALVAKLCGNFLIAAQIEANAEMLALAENNGVDRQEVMSLLSSTIFDCLIYRGYGNRIAGRRHLQDLDHPGFALELGFKDVNLVLDLARRSNTPMPFGSVLHDRFQSAANRGRGQLDWSAIGLSVSEDAGVDVRDAVANPKPE